MFCRSCGREVDAGDQHCRHCGKPQGATPRAKGTGGNAILAGGVRGAVTLAIFVGILLVIGLAVVSNSP
jgi:uncharacterized membrane protein YvbJ